MKTNSLKTTTRTFKSGNSIAVRIPREFNLEAGKTFEIKRRGRELVLVEQEETLAGLIAAFKSFPPDFFADGRMDALPKPIPAFDDVVAEKVLMTQSRPIKKSPKKKV